MNTFKFIGQIKMLENKKDRKFIETVDFDSGWTIERVKFRMICGDSSEFVDLSGGKFKDDAKNTVYTLFRKSATGTNKEVEKAQVAWKDRFNADIIEKVPGYKRYTIDLSSDKIRKALEEKIGKDFSVSPVREEGVRDARWAVIDYGDVIVHIMLDETRLFYHLERLWADGDNLIKFEE